MKNVEFFAYEVLWFILGRTSASLIISVYYFPLKDFKTKNKLVLISYNLCFIYKKTPSFVSYFDLLTWLHLQFGCHILQKEIPTVLNLSIDCVFIMVQTIFFYSSQHPYFVTKNHQLLCLINTNEHTNKNVA